MTCETGNSGSESMSNGGSENSDSEYYVDDGTDGTNAAGAETHHGNPQNMRIYRRQSIHVPLPSTFQHYGSFYLRMGAVGKFGHRCAPNCSLTVRGPSSKDLLITPITPNYIILIAFIYCSCRYVVNCGLKNTHEKKN